SLTVSRRSQEDQVPALDWPRMYVRPSRYWMYRWTTRPAVLGRTSRTPAMAEGYFCAVEAHDPDSWYQTPASLTPQSSRLWVVSAGSGPRRRYAVFRAVVAAIRASSESSRAWVALASMPFAVDSAALAVTTAASAASRASWALLSMPRATLSAFAAVASAAAAVSRESWAACSALLAAVVATAAAAFAALAAAVARSAASVAPSTPAKASFAVLTAEAADAKAAFAVPSAVLAVLRAVLEVS